MAIQDKTNTSQSATFGPGLLPDFPRAVPTLLDLPGFTEQEQRYNEWWDTCRKQISYVNTGFGQTLSQRLGILSAEISEEATIRATEDLALASQISSVSATVGALSAAVTAEATARATADGFLEGKYTLTVTAGDVVTGMNITSSSGGGTNVSQVTFQADKFQIYNGTTGIPAFIVSGGNVTVNGSITLSNSQVTGLGALATLSTVGWSTHISGRPVELTDGRVAIALSAAGGVLLSVVAAPSGSGLFLGSDKLGFFSGGSWKTYMDNSGNFFLSGAGTNFLNWNGTTLSVNGTITSTSGNIGGFNLASGVLTAGSGSNSLALITSLSGVIAWECGSPTAGTGPRTQIGNSYFRVVGTNGGDAAQLTVSGTTGSFQVIQTTTGTVVANMTLGGSGGALSLHRVTSGITGVSLGIGGGGAGSITVNDSGGSTTITADGSTGTVTASSFSGAGSAITSINASNISSGTLNNSRLPSAISVTSLAATSIDTQYLEAGVATAVDVKDGNLRVFSGATQTFRVDFTNGQVFIQGTRILTTRQPAPVTLADVIAAGQAHGLWS